MENLKEAVTESDIQRLLECKLDILNSQICSPFMDLPEELSVSDKMKWIPVTRLLTCYFNICERKILLEKMGSSIPAEEKRAYLADSNTLVGLRTSGSRDLSTILRSPGILPDKGMVDEIINEFDRVGIHKILTYVAFNRLILAISILDPKSDKNTWNSPVFNEVYEAANRILKNNLSDKDLMKAAKFIESKLATMVKSHVDLLTDPVKYIDEVYAKLDDSIDPVTVSSSRQAVHTSKQTEPYSKHMEARLSNPLFKFVLLVGYYKEFSRADKMLGRYCMLKNNQVSPKDAKKLDAYIKGQIDDLEDCYPSCARFAELPKARFNEIVREAARNIYNEIKSLKFYDIGDTVTCDDDILSIFDIYVNAKTSDVLSNIALRCVVDGIGSGRRRA